MHVKLLKLFCCANLFILGCSENSTENTQVDIPKIDEVSVVFSTGHKVYVYDESDTLKWKQLGNIKPVEIKVGSKILLFNY